jgi:hypothetical protein
MLMALVPCVVCASPFYASCHDASCVDAICPFCEYADTEEEEDLIAQAAALAGVIGIAGEGDAAEIPLGAASSAV